jgi:hypothetical protein
MKRVRWQDLFFSVTMIVFFSLLISGGSRLIAVPEPDALGCSVPVHFDASLSCPPEHVEQTFLLSRQESKNAAYADVHYLEQHEVACKPLITDANGNIVMHCNYMHAVYQTFALGDGFV